MTIKHLVISGGGPSMIQMLGSIQYLEENKFIDFKNIETIYGTSSGTIVGVLIALNFDKETINDYVIKRPWQELFTIKVQNILDIYTKKGMYGNETFEKIFKPLFDAKDISINITLEEFYHFSKIELHFITFDINYFQLEDISYLNNPSLKLIHAVQMSCSYPILISPICLDDKCYVDGGVISNYPLQYCIESGKKEEEILGFKNVYDFCDNKITSDSTLIDFILYLLKKLVKSLSSKKEYKITNEVKCNAKELNLSYLNTAFNSIDFRKELYENGEKYSKIFLDNLQNSI